MLSADDYAFMKSWFDQGVSISEIARQTGYDRKTVKKYVSSPTMPLWFGPLLLGYNYQLIITASRHRFQKSSPLKIRQPVTGSTWHERLLGNPARPDDIAASPDCQAHRRLLLVAADNWRLLFNQSLSMKNDLIPARQSLEHFPAIFRDS
jgi:hypothetical protein